MEGYIKKINDKLVAKNDEQYAKKIKFRYLLIGGIILGIGVAGFLASFVTFMVLFFKFKTDDAFTAWIVAVPFLLAIIAGSVLTRIGDALPPSRKLSNSKTKSSQEEKAPDKQ